MLIEFSVSNFLSFRNKVTLSMLATKPIKEHLDDNVIISDRYNLLKSAIIYGANASGKSNLLSAIKFMKWFCINSSKEMQAEEAIDIQQFKLSSSSKKQPSHFEIVMIIDNNKYRYGFEVNRKEVVSEWLFHAAKIKEYPLYIRENDRIEVMKGFPEGENLEEKTRKNALFLSVAAQFNGQISMKILSWFKKFNHISGLMDERYEAFTVNLLENKKYKTIILEFLNRADIGINDIELNEYDITYENLPEEMPDSIKKEVLKKLKGEKKFRLFTVHEIYNEKNEVEGLAIFDFENEESEGTKKYLKLSGPIIDTLSNGNILSIDELDARLHPILTKIIVKLFNSKDTNPHNAQLIVATHDINLLNAAIFRRDQIWFIEKTRDNSSDLYSLAEYRLPKGKVRKDASYAKDYIRGRYGAIPYIGKIDDLFRDVKWLERQN